MSSPPGQSQTAALPPNFKLMFDAALAEYKKKTGDDLLAHWLATELQTCESVDAVLDILRDQAKTFEQSGDRKLMRWIDPLVHVLHTFSGALGDGVSMAFPPAKVIFTGIGALLAAAKDARASHGAVIDLFERIESFFKRLEVYNQISLTTKMAEVLVKIVIELLSILSIATKEVKLRRAKIFARKLLGRTNIEDALKRLDSLIQEEVQMAIAQILKLASEVKYQLKDGADKTNRAMQQMSKDVEEVKWAQIAQDIHKWFSPPDPSTNYNNACKAHQEGTAAWFYRDSKFKDWLLVGSLLWIHGKPGSGKSILCSTLIKHVMSLRDAGQVSLAYFYFDFRDEEKKQDIRNFLTSLLVQLSAYSSPCCKIISRIYSAHGKGTQQPSNDVLTNCLREMLSLAAQQPVFLIVDALDECPDSSGMPTPREDVLNLLEGLIRLRLPNLHICVTSRPEIDIQNVLGPLSSSAVSLHDGRGQKEDISDYVRNAVYSDKKMQRWRNDEKELVIEELSQKVDGMFRWVFCQLEVLRHCLPASIRQTLDQLPESLDETYLRVLSQIPQANQAHAHRMLQCLMVAIRPLRVEELAELLAFEFDAAQGGMPPKYRAARRLDNQTQAVLSTCSSLVTIVYDYRYWPSPQVVQFSHFSVKEFLMSNRLGDFSRYHIHPVSAHTILTQACLGSILHLDDHINHKSVNGSPLANYAAQHWVEHARFEDVASRVKHGIEALFDSDKPHFAAWVGINDMDNWRSYWLDFSDPEKSPPSKPNPLYYSVLCGFYDLVKHLAMKHPQHVNAIFGRYRSPLFAALCKGRIEIAELLLEHGADATAADNKGRTTLHRLLSESWNDDEGDVINIALLLLKHGAEVNAQDKGNQTLLHLAVGRDRSKLASILVKHGADAAAADNKGRTVLHRLLSESRNKDEGDVINLVLLLLKYGAKVNRQDEGNETPLHLAVRRDLLKLAVILLEHGANADVENNQGKTPLSILVERLIYGTSGLTRVLKHKRSGSAHDSDTEVNRRYQDNETPLLNADASKTRETPVHQVSRRQYDTRDRSAGVSQPLPERGVDITAGPTQDESHLTPSHLQSNFSPAQIFQALLDHGANANRGGVTSFHRGQELKGVHQTPLHLALFSGRLDIARVLLEGGATTANSEDNFGWTPLHLAVRGMYNSKQDRIRVTQLLLERGADVHAQDKVNATPLHLSSCYGMVEIARVLLDGGATTNSKSLQGWSPLHAAVEGGRHPFMDNYVLVAQLLLERGADVDVPDDEGQTPLHLASYFRKAEMALVLLNAGAYANAKDAQGQTPLHLVSQYQYPGPDDSQGDGVGIAQLLLDHGADVNAQDNGHATPSDLASYHGRTEITALLLQYGGKANAKIGNQRPTPLPSRPGLASVQFLDEDCTSSRGATLAETDRPFYP